EAHRRTGLATLHAYVTRTVAAARSGPARPYLTLHGRRPGDPPGLEPAHARSRIEDARADEARIDDDADAFDREARLGDVGREHDLALAGRARRERGVLRRGVEIAVERHDPHAVHAAVEQRLYAADL